MTTTASGSNGHERSQRRPPVGRPPTDPSRRSASTSATAAATSPAPSTSRRSATGPAERLAPHGVVIARDNKFMCSSTGQELIEKDIEELGLTRVVVAACSPHMHEKTFRGACERAGLNPYLCELVSIREQVSWVHTDQAAATAKAEGRRRRRRVPGRGARAARADPGPHQPGDARGRRRHRRHHGGPRARRRRLPGPPGRARAVDRRPHGPVRQDVPDARLRRLHPDPEDERGRDAPERHPPHLERGDRRHGLRRQLRGHDPPQGALRQRRPVHRLRHLPGEVPGQGRSTRSTRPASATARSSTCRSRRPSRSSPSSTWPTASTSRRGTCKACEKFCPTGAIDFDQQDDEVTVEVGNIVIATGFELFDARRVEPYGYGRLPNVFTSLEFERMSNAAGPTSGRIVLRDGVTEPRSVAIVHCVGSRDRNYNAYCSAICCMQSLKFAHLVREHTDADRLQLLHRHPGAGQGVRRVLPAGPGRGHDVRPRPRGRGDRRPPLPEEAGQDGRLIVQVEDTLAGRQRRIPVDMVILSAGLEPPRDAQEIARRFGDLLQLERLGDRAAPEARPGRHDDRGRLRRRLRARPAGHPDQRRERGRGRGPHPRPDPAEGDGARAGPRHGRREPLLGLPDLQRPVPVQRDRLPRGPRRERGERRPSARAAAPASRPARPGR